MAPRPTAPDAPMTREQADEIIANQRQLKEHGLENIGSEIWRAGGSAVNAVGGFLNDWVAKPAAAVVTSAHHFADKTLSMALRKANADLGLAWGPSALPMVHSASARVIDYALSHGENLEGGYDHLRAQLIAKRDHARELVAHPNINDPAAVRTNAGNYAALVEAIGVVARAHEIITHTTQGTALSDIKDAHAYINQQNGIHGAAAGPAAAAGQHGHAAGQHGHDADHHDRTAAARAAARAHAHPHVKPTAPERPHAPPTAAARVDPTFGGPAR